MEEIPEELASTDLPQKWGKPRSKKVYSECLLDVTIYYPPETPPKKTLRQNPCNCNNVMTKGTLQRAQNELNSENQKIDMAYLLSAGVSDMNLVTLLLGLMTEKFCATYSAGR